MPTATSLIRIRMNSANIASDVVEGSGLKNYPAFCDLREKSRISPSSPRALRSPPHSNQHPWNSAHRVAALEQADPHLLNETPGGTEGGQSMRWMMLWAGQSAWPGHHFFLKNPQLRIHYLYRA